MAVENNKRVTGIRPTSWAMVVGVFWAIVGLAVAILASLVNTVEYSQETNSVLAGLTFGLATGAVMIIVIPLVYFAIGWIIGVVQGFIFNVVLGSSGGLVMTIEENKE